MQTPTMTNENAGDASRVEPSIPLAPRTVEDTGLEFLFLVELVSKVLFLRGRMSLAALSSHLKLPISVLESVLAFMRNDHTCELVSRGDTSASTYFQLTDTGRARASDFMRRNQYAGPAPVSYESYCKQVESQLHHGVRYTREVLAEGFKGIVIQDGVLDQLGAGMNSSRAIFIYGPSGSGKTFIAEHLMRLLSDLIAVPHAIYVDNEVIQVFDPLVHQQLEQKPTISGHLELRNPFDMRWVICKRPIAISGGELTLATLDLEFDQATRYYKAPLHMKANNGLYIIDDLGHQSISPQELMNRWIVPLDRRRDYLALHTGFKFQIPFDVKVVFSSNLDPNSLADEAFLRRIGYKIYVGAVSESQYASIFRQVCDELSIPFCASSLEHLVHNRHYNEGRPLLACNPRDLISQVRDFAMYEGKQPMLSPESLDWAWQNYFATRQQDISEAKVLSVN